MKRHRQPRAARATASAALPRNPGRTLLGLPIGVTIALGLSLALLLAHAGMYWFLTDDAYISFRYSRNLAQGHGLVFNPGFERVEGYTNFLWVLVLAALDKLGWAPERAANALSLLATVGLWWVVVDFVRRRLVPGSEWVVLVPAFALALTRSVAVWSTSGLETRAFELLLVSGVLRLVDEVEALERGDHPRPVAVTLLALATLTRPDGLLMSACAFAAAAGRLFVKRRERLLAWGLSLSPYVLLVGGHFLFRYYYYGDWLPNTYYAKVGGETWWSSGGRYLSAFALEYGVLFWLPLLVYSLRAGRSVLLLMTGAVVLPHTLYVAAIGGDHFEYRPLGVLMILAFVLFADGARALAASRWRVAGAAAVLLLVALGLTVIPWASHRQFVRAYVSGFPGLGYDKYTEARDFLAPERVPILNLPLVRSAARAHQDLIRWLTKHFVAVRQEEHELFVATTILEGQRLARLREAGTLPADLHIAVDCVGAVPYYSQFRTLDRFGLTDAHVARSPRVRQVMAHGKSATLDYAREQGVDLWSEGPAYLILPVTSIQLLLAVQDQNQPPRNYDVVDVGDDGFIACALPQGREMTQRKLGATRIYSLGDTTFRRLYLERARRQTHEWLAGHPEDISAARQMGYLLLLAEDNAAAVEHYSALTRTAPELVEAWENLAVAEFRLGRLGAAIEHSAQALALAQRQGDGVVAARLAQRLEAMRPVN